MFIWESISTVQNATYCTMQCESSQGSKTGRMLCIVLCFIKPGQLAER